VQLVFFFPSSGKVECALFGDYVAILQGMLAKAGTGLPVVVVQFAKIKIFAGYNFFFWFVELFPLCVILLLNLFLFC
jgi:hypothetical protein